MIENIANKISDDIEHLDSFEKNMFFENLILDVKGASQFLGVSTKTIYNHQDEIPHRRIGKQIRFLLPDLIKWFQSGG